MSWRMVDGLLGVEMDAGGPGVLAGDVVEGLEFSQGKPRFAEGDPELGAAHGHRIAEGHAGVGHAVEVQVERELLRRRGGRGAVTAQEEIEAGVDECFHVRL